MSNGLESKNTGTGKDSDENRAVMHSEGVRLMRVGGASAEAPAARKARNPNVVPGRGRIASRYSAAGRRAPP